MSGQARALTPGEVRALLEGATRGPWRYRPNEHDDWGMVRGQDGHLVATALGGREVTQAERQAHREAGTDPYAGNAALIAAAPSLIADLLAQNAALAAELARAQAGAQAVEAEVVKLRRDLAHERHSHSNTIDSRDRMHEAADRLAYAAFDIDDIGEHSSANCPWENAAELLEDHAGGIHELVFGPPLPAALAQASAEGAGAGEVAG